MGNPEGVWSILDTDLYKLTMQCAVHKYFPDTHVTYHFTNRTSDMKFTREAYDWLAKQIDRLANIKLTDDELAYLHKSCGYLNHESYLDFLKSFRFRPSEHVKVEFKPSTDNRDKGDIDINTAGLWQDTILYEIPLLALVSEAYFKFCDRDWNYDGQEQNAFEKGAALIRNGCVFSEFGSRRRRDYHTQDLVMQGLTRANKEIKDGDGKMSGSSNVHFSMKFGVSPVGTVAHEWFMGIAASSGDYKTATAKALEYWVMCFGRGTLGIALTDTFGTPVFLKSFAERLPSSMTGLTEGWVVRKPTFADIFAGTRQDSGDPKKFIKLMRNFYREHGTEGKKTMVFSDSLDVDKCILYKKLAETRDFAPTFGIGTFLTSE